MKKHTISFKNAFSGLIYAFKSQPNYKIHLFFSLVAIIGSFVFKISYFEFIIIIFLIFVGLTIETINTTIEATTDAIDISWREDIKIAKDASAAAMLIIAIGSLVVSGLIFIPKIWYLLKF